MSVRVKIGVWPAGIDESAGRAVRFVPRLKTHEFLEHRVDPACRNQIALKRRAGIGAIRKSGRGSRIVDWVSNSAKAEIASQHIRGGNSCEDGLSGNLLVALESHQKEGLVVPVIDSRYHHSAIQRSRSQLIVRARRHRPIRQTDTRLLLDVLRPDVRGHDDDGVLEVHTAS